MRVGGAAPAAALAALAALPGCLGGFGGDKALVDSAVVTRGEIVIAGPRGFCVDTPSLRDRSDGGFVLLASCAALTGAPDAPHPAIPGVLIAMVSAAPDADGLSAALADVERYFRSDEGQAALSRAGDPDGVEVLQSRITGEILFLQVRDASVFDGPDIEPDYWRAILSVKGHILTLSAMAPAGQSGDGALATLEAFISRIRRANAPPPVTPQPVPGVQEARAGAVERPI